MDPLSKARRREVMQKIGRRNTPPELAVRRCLHAMGYRYRLHVNSLPGKPDIVLPRWRVVVLVHGCFWHGCPACFRGHRVPKTNRAYWVNKIRRNRDRDGRTGRALAELGWRVIEVWECQTADRTELSCQLLRALRATASEEPAGWGAIIARFADIGYRMKSRLLRAAGHASPATGRASGDDGRRSNTTAQSSSTLIPGRRRWSIRWQLAQTIAKSSSRVGVAPSKSASGARWWHSANPSPTGP